MQAGVDSDGGAFKVKEAQLSLATYVPTYAWSIGRGSRKVVDLHNSGLSEICTIIYLRTV